MILLALLLILVAGGVLAGLLGARSPLAARVAALAALSIDLLLAVLLWGGLHGSAPGGGPWIAEIDLPWIPALGIRFHLALDGLSLPLVALTFLLGALAVVASWSEVRERVGFFHLSLLGVLAGVYGVFTAIDLFLFYFFWELMLIPMAVLIAVWGHERRLRAAVKFFIYTQAGGLLMLAAILALVAIHFRRSGVISFDLRDLLASAPGGAAGLWLAGGFLIAFAVKLPAVPLHGWLPDAHTEAPTAGSVVLAGLLLKTGAYGIFRFVLPLFPEAARDLAPWASWIGVAGIIYGAVLAFAQDDLKRMVAYSSVSHLGFVLLGIFALDERALQGAVLQMVCHGISTGALFILVGALQERLHTRDLRRMGGLWPSVPRMGALALLFAMASLGLPGLGNFLAELLVLLGSFRGERAAACIAALGLIAAAVYSLALFGRAFQGPPREGTAPRGPLRDLGLRDVAVLGILAAAIVWLGLYPAPVLEAAVEPLRGILARVRG